MFRALSFFSIPVKFTVTAPCDWNSKILLTGTIFQLNKEKKNDPNLVLEDTEVQPIGKYGRMRKRYLKEHRPGLYSTMLLEGELFQHLAEIEKACEERIDLLTQQMAKREAVTEALKAVDQLEWVRRMNNIRNRAEEIVLHELVYG